MLINPTEEYLQFNSLVKNYVFCAIVVFFFAPIIYYFSPYFSYLDLIILHPLWIYVIYFEAVACCAPFGIYYGIKILYNLDINSDYLKTAMKFLFIALTLAAIVQFILWPKIIEGDIKVIMNDSNNINHIPVQIITTGYCGNLTVNLTQTSINGNILNDTIKMIPSSENETVFSNNFQGSALDYGVYKIFINTTNLTQGYYELSFSKDLSRLSKFSKELGFPQTEKKYNSLYLSKVT